MNVNRIFPYNIGGTISKEKTALNIITAVATFLNPPFKQGVTLILIFCLMTISVSNHFLIQQNIKCTSVSFHFSCVLWLMTDIFVIVDITLVMGLYNEHRNISISVVYIEQLHTITQQWSYYYDTNY